MKTKILTLLLSLTTVIVFAQNQPEQINTTQEIQNSENTIYKLFPTTNYWTFIKLDTRNGRMWQVHFTVEEDGGSGELSINSMPLVEKEEEANGRFTLYPTKNMYNFLLLDQISGVVYQVQWSVQSENRGIVSVIMPIEE